MTEQLHFLSLSFSFTAFPCQQPQIRAYTRFSLFSTLKLSYFSVYLCTFAKTQVMTGESVAEVFAYSTLIVWVDVFKE